MKPKFIVLIALLSLILSSCFVKSLHPFYEENDLYFDKALLTTWVDKDTNYYCVKQIYSSYGEGSNKKEYWANGYVVSHFTKKGKVADKKYDVYLFKINNQLYADITSSFFPDFKMDEGLTEDKIRTHILAKVKITNDELEFIFFNGEWLAGLIENNKIKISHEFLKYSEQMPSFKYKGEYILTASTDELQKFIAKYGNDPNAFAPMKSKLPDGVYQWHTGNGEFTGNMTFGENPDNSLKLKRQK